MITATCNTENCVQTGIPFFIGGFPDHVECGGCGQPTTLSDPQPDPPPPPSLFA